MNTEKHGNMNIVARSSSYTFRESLTWNNAVHVAISVYGSKKRRVHNASYPRRATKAVSRRIRKRPCCQESAGCSKELLKKSDSAAKKE